MRRWNVPAVRYSVGGRRCRSSVGLYYCSSRVEYSTLHAKPRPSPIQLRKRHNSRTSINDIRIARPFSNTCSQRIKFEDDEEEQPPQPTPRYRATRTRPEKRPMPAKTDLSGLIRSRRAPPPPPPKPLNPAHLREIDRMAGKVFSLDLPRLSTKFLQLKWAHLDDHISDCARITWQFREEYSDVISVLVGQLEDRVQQSNRVCQKLEHQYCRIVFRGIPHLTQQVSRSVREITQLRVTASAVLVRHSQRATFDIRNQLQREFLSPRYVARAHIDGLLNYSANLQLRYMTLKEKGRIAKANLLDIIQDCRGLGPKFRRHYENLGLHEIQYSGATHQHRYAWLNSQKRHDPLRMSELWDITKAPGPLPPPDFDPISAILFDDKFHIAARRKLEKRPLLQASRIRTLYMSRWKPGISAQSPEMDMYWRQLDIMAPFFIQVKHCDVLLNESRYLLGTFTGQLGPLWSKIESVEKERYKTSLWKIVGKIRANRQDLLEELASYRSINWLRLGLERRLAKFDLPNEIQESGLFVVPNPLSQDYSRFRDWSLTFASLVQSAWIPRRAFEWSKGANSGTWQSWQDSLVNAERRRILETRARAMDLGFVTQRKGRIRPCVPESGSSNRRKPKHKSAEKSKLQPEANADEGVENSAKGGSVRGEKSAVELEKQMPETNETRRKHPRKGNSTVAENSSSKQSGDQNVVDRKHSGKRPGSIPPATLNAQSTFQSASSKRRYTTAATPLNSRNDSISEPTENDSPKDATTTDYIPQTQEDPSTSSSTSTNQFWTHASQRGPNGQKPTVHYCRTLESSEEISKLFLKDNSKVLGFDLEWKAQASATDTIQNNLSLIQLANESRIALFHVALFKPARTIDDFVPPSLKRILEDEGITKVGVSIKADATRLRKFLGIDSRSLFELSHLFKLVRFGLVRPGLVNKRLVSLAEQAAFHFGLPLEKSEDVRCGDWARPLSYRQVQYAATDPYACICLFGVMEAKRVAMRPMPPRPAHAELNLPILLPKRDSEGNADVDVGVDGDSRAEVGLLGNGQ